MIVEPLSQHLRLYLLRNLHTSGGTKSLLWSAIMIFRNIGEKSNTYLLDITVNSKLTCGQGSHHEQASADAGITAAQSEFFGNLDQTASCPFTGKTLCFVDFAKHGICGLRNQGSSEAGNKTGTKIDGRLHAGGERVLVDSLVDEFRDLLENDELGHGVWDSVNGLVADVCTISLILDLLLEQNGAETGVEGTHTLILQDLPKATQEATSEGWLGDETDTGSF